MNNLKIGYRKDSC